MPIGARAKVRDKGLVVLWTVLTLGIWTLTLVAIPPYVQSGLNKIWNLYPAAEDGQVQLPLAAAHSQPQPAPAAGQAPPEGPPPDPADRLD